MLGIFKFIIACFTLGFDDNLLNFQSAPPVSTPSNDVSSLLNDLMINPPAQAAPVIQPTSVQVPRLPSPPKPKQPSVTM